MIFDCDGVLVDSEPVTCAVMAEALSEIGLPTTAEECMRDYVGRWWPDCVEIIEAKLGHELPAGFTARYRERQNAALAAGVEPVTGVAEALDRVTVAVCVASNGPLEKMRITLGAAGLLERFEGRMFSAADVERGKPAPDLFLHAAKAIGVAPSDCAVVEDTPLGIEAARAAGMGAFGFSPHGDGTALAGAGAVIFDSMQRIPAVLGLDRGPPTDGH